MNRKIPFLLAMMGTSLVLFVVFGKAAGHYFLSCWFAGIALLPAAAAIYLLLRDFHEGSAFRLRVLQGVFFSQLGEQLLQTLVSADPEGETLKEALTRREPDINAVKFRMEKGFSLQVSELDLEILKVLLVQHKDLVLKLLLNEATWKEGSFGTLLIYILHLCKELEKREDLSTLSEEDYKYLQKYLTRIYQLLLRHWVEQLLFLEKKYPELFEAQLRNNPFSSASSPDQDFAD